MDLFDSLNSFVSDLLKNLSSEEVVKLRSCKKCSYYKQGYCTQTPVPTRVLSEYYAQGCLFFSPEETVVPTPRRIEIGEQIQLSGLNWFDRNPKSIGDHWGDLTQPHAMNARFYYICPKGKIAMIEVINLSITAIELGAAYLRGFAWMQVRQDANGENSLLCTPAYVTNAPTETNQRAAYNLGATFMLYGEEKITFYSQHDGDNDSRFNFHLSFKGTEFDA